MQRTMQHAAHHATHTNTDVVYSPQDLLAGLHMAVPKAAVTEAQMGTRTFVRGAAPKGHKINTRRSFLMPTSGTAESSRYVRYMLRDMLCRQPPHLTHLPACRAVSCRAVPCRAYTTSLHPFSLKNYLMPGLPTAVKSNAAKVAAMERDMAEAKEESIARNPLQIKKDYGKGSAAARKRTQKVNAAIDRHVYGGGVVDGSTDLVVSETHVYISKVAICLPYKPYKPLHTCHFMTSCYSYQR